MLHFPCIGMEKSQTLTARSPYRLQLIAGDLSRNVSCDQLIVRDHFNKKGLSKTDIPNKIIFGYHTIILALFPPVPFNLQGNENLEELEQRSDAANHCGEKKDWTGKIQPDLCLTKNYVIVIYH